MNTTAIGVGVALGTSFGVVVFALTQSPIWIALGSSFGIVVGVVVSNMSPEDE